MNNPKLARLRKQVRRLRAVMGALQAGTVGHDAARKEYLGAAEEHIKEYDRKHPDAERLAWSQEEYDNVLEAFVVK